MMFAHPVIAFRFFAVVALSVLALLSAGCATDGAKAQGTAAKDAVGGGVKSQRTAPRDAPSGGLNVPTTVPAEALVAYYYDHDKLIYVEDLHGVQGRALHGNHPGSPFPLLMGDCASLPVPEAENVDVMHGGNGTPTRAIYISETQVLVHEDLRALSFRMIKTLKAETGGGACACFCVPCGGGRACCCPTCQ